MKWSLNSVLDASLTTTYTLARESLQGARTQGLFHMTALASDSKMYTALVISTMRF